MLNSNSSPSSMYMLFSYFTTKKEEKTISKCDINKIASVFKNTVTSDVCQFSLLPRWNASITNN